MLQRHSQTAFTLIELLIVLAIVGTVSAFVAPNLWRSLERAGERQLVLDYGSETLALRRDLYRRHRSLVVVENQLLDPENTSGFPAPPQGWSISRHTALRFLPSGVCSGGSIVFEAPSGRRWQLAFALLDGRMSVTGV